MISKADRFYYENFVLAAEEAHKAAVYLVECLSDYKPEKIVQMLETMHGYEHAGDTKKHEMKDMLTELPNFKKPAKLHDMIVALNALEEECDRMYLDATRKARDDFDDVFTVICWREIYDKMERCADACEHVGDCVEMIVMKNT